MDPMILNPTDPSSKIVLGVDDAPENLMLLQAAVRAGGYSFMGAESGSKCLSLLNRFQPRLILLDIEMPEMDGFEACRQIRAIPAWRHIPVAFLTARKAAEDVKRCIEVGGNDFIVKPFDVTKLIERVKYWSARRAPAAVKA